MASLIMLSTSSDSMSSPSDWQMSFISVTEMKPVPLRDGKAGKAERLSQVHSRAYNTYTCTYTYTYTHTYTSSREL